MAKQQKVIFKIPFGISAKAREAVGWEIVRYIQERTSGDQVDKNGKRFARYSKEYADKKGVSRGDVDLINSGDMLLQLIVLTHRPGSITIGYPPGDPINDKVEGNRLGTYGQKNPIPGKARDFLGLTDEELVDIFSIALAEFDINENIASLERTIEESGDIDDSVLESLQKKYE